MKDTTYTDTIRWRTNCFEQQQTYLPYPVWGRIPATSPVLSRPNTIPPPALAPDIPPIQGQCRVRPQLSSEVPGLKTAAGHELEDPCDVGQHYGYGGNILVAVYCAVRERVDERHGPR